VDQQEIMTMPSAKKKANNLAPATMQKELKRVASLAVYEKMTGAGDMKKIQQEKYLYNIFMASMVVTTSFLIVTF
jgi:hypothetical protein